MRRSTLTTTLLFVTIAAFSQNKKTFYEAAITISKPAYFQDISTNNAWGIGVELQREYFFSHKFSWIISAGYNHFTGEYFYFNYTGSGKDSAIHSFDNIPLQTGTKFYFLKNLYAGAETGLLISLNKNVTTVFALIPSAGYKITIDKNNSIEIGVRLVNAIQFAAAPESNNLRKGGYGMWSFKIAYSF